MPRHPDLVYQELKPLKDAISYFDKRFEQILSPEDYCERVHDLASRWVRAIKSSEISSSVLLEVNIPGLILTPIRYGNESADQRNNADQLFDWVRAKFRWKTVAALLNNSSDARLNAVIHLCTQFANRKLADETWLKGLAADAEKVRCARIDRGALTTKEYYRILDEYEQGIKAVKAYKALRR